MWLTLLRVGARAGGYEDYDFSKGAGFDDAGWDFGSGACKHDIDAKQIMFRSLTHRCSPPLTADCTARAGAGFYVNATQEPWSANFHMYDYITKELPAVVAANFDKIDVSKASITGHSMGGHGALTIALKNPGVYKSASAFAPICNPVNCPWGEKAFTGYLGEDKSLWAAHDATELVKNYAGPDLHFLIDQVRFSLGFLLV